MREIKFRAFNTETNHMISWDEMGDDHWDLFNEFKNCKTIMQFTGLRDKNGKDAWEGDIIYIKHCECVGHNQDGEEIWESRKGVISFEDSMFVFDGHSCGTLPLYAYKDSFEVIGNIHQNPELLQS